MGSLGGMGGDSERRLRIRPSVRLLCRRPPTAKPLSVTRPWGRRRPGRSAEERAYQFGHLEERDKVEGHGTVVFLADIGNIVNSR